MKISVKSIGLMVAIFLFAVIPAFSIPLLRTEKKTIQGTVVDWTWRGELYYQEEFEGVAFGQTIPNHYVIRLKLPKKRDKLFDTINWYSRLLPIGIGIDGDEMKQNEVIVYLPSPRLKGLLRGSKLTIEDYSIIADDSGPSAGNSKILINGTTPKVLPSVFPQTRNANKTEQDNR